MNIHLISPTHYLRDGSLHKTTRYWTSGITLPYLKALTPPEHEVTFTDELMQDSTSIVERDADVVGLTAMGPQIRARLRSRRSLPRARQEGRPRRHLGDAHAGGVAAARRRGRRGRGRVRLARRARRPRRRPLARHLPRRALARSLRDLPQIDYWSCRSSRPTLPLELALPDVLLLADLLLARLPASLRVLRGADVLPAHLPHAARRRRSSPTSQTIAAASAADGFSSSTTTRSRTRRRRRSSSAR